MQAECMYEYLVVIRDRQVLQSEMQAAVCVAICKCSAYAKCVR